MGLSYYTWDDIALWSVRGYGIALDGTVASAERWGNSGLRYPLNMPLLIGLFRLIDGDVLPGSKLLFPAFYGSILLAVLAFWRRRMVPSTVRVVGILALGTTPLLFTHATTGYANLPFTFYLVTGNLVLGEGVEDKSARHLLLGGILLGLASWTRPEGLLLGVACAAIHSLALLRGPHRWSGVLAMILPMLLLAAPWIIFEGSLAPRGVVGEVGAVGLGRLLRSDVQWDAFYVIGKYFAGQVIRFRVWGAFVPLAVLLGFISIASRRARVNGVGVVLALVSSVTLGALVFGMYYLTSYSGELVNWLSSGFNRMMMPAAVLATTASVPVIVAHLRDREAETTASDSPVYGQDSEAL